MTSRKTSVPLEWMKQFLGNSPPLRLQVMLLMTFNWQSSRSQAFSDAVIRTGGITLNMTTIRVVSAVAVLAPFQALQIYVPWLSAVTPTNDRFPPERLHFPIISCPSARLQVMRGEGAPLASHGRVTFPCSTTATKDCTFVMVEGSKTKV